MKYAVGIWNHWLADGTYRDVEVLLDQHIEPLEMRWVDDKSLLTDAEFEDVNESIQGLVAFDRYEHLSWFAKDHKFTLTSERPNWSKR